MNSVSYMFATCISIIPSFILQSILRYIICIQVDIKVEFKKVIMFRVSLFIGILKMLILLSSSLTSSKRKLFENYIMTLTWYVLLNNLIICIYSLQYFRVLLIWLLLIISLLCICAMVLVSFSQSTKHYVLVIKWLFIWLYVLVI